MRIANCAQRHQASAGAGETIRADLHRLSLAPFSVASPPEGRVGRETGGWFGGGGGGGKLQMSFVPQTENLAGVTNRGSLRRSGQKYTNINSTIFFISGRGTLAFVLVTGMLQPTLLLLLGQQGQTVKSSAIFHNGNVFSVFLQKQWHAFNAFLTDTDSSEPTVSGINKQGSFLFLFLF